MTSEKLTTAATMPIIVVNATFPILYLFTGDVWKIWGRLFAKRIAAIAVTNTTPVGPMTAPTVITE